MAGVVAADADGDPMAPQLRIRETRMNAFLTTLSTLAVAAALAAGPTPAAAQATGAKPAAAPAAKPATKPATKPAQVQRTFATPEDAAAALLEAMNTDSLSRIHAVLGPGSGKLIRSGDKVADQQLRDDFSAAYAAAMRIEPAGDGKATLVIGKNDYPFPFPLVKGAAGWRFDAHAGAEELLNRRIGENELSAINTCLAYVDAQREYAVKDRDGNGFKEYAQKWVSAPGKRDGLYWQSAPGEPESPLGPLAAAAGAQGYGKNADAYHGYRFRILKSQGKNAAGGAYDYVVDGRMIGGFALVAWPARWGVSGVMTFVCNHDGVVFQKNLGSETPKLAAAITRYDPDATWSKAQP